MREKDLDLVVRQQMLTDEQMKELISRKTEHEQEGVLPYTPCGKISLNEIILFKHQYY